MRLITHVWRLLAVRVLLALLVGGANMASAADRQNDIKAAFIFNFARFTTWPADLFDAPHDPIRVCYHEGHHLADALAQIDGKPVGDHAIALIVHGQGEAFGQRCHIALVGPGNAFTPMRGVLTVSDETDFVEQGGAVGLTQTGRQIRFQINLTSIKRSELQMSSRLMRLAARVKQ